MVIVIGNSIKSQRNGFGRKNSLGNKFSLTQATLVKGKMRGKMKENKSNKKKTTV
jgi:hypothetical protein